MKYTTAIHDNYNLITVQAALLDTKEMEILEQELHAQMNTDIHSIIVVIKDVENITVEACHAIVSIHNKIYNDGNSIAFAEPSDLVYKKLKQEQIHLVTNICPTLQEAIDIINMEILERDLLSEE